MTSVKRLSVREESRPVEQHAVALMGHLMQEVRDIFSAEDWNGLRQSHFRLMSSVPRDGIRITDLGERLGMTKQASGQFVSFLIGTGHLEARSDPRDARVRVVVRTPLGDQTVKAVEARIRRIERAWAKVVGPARYGEFRRVLVELGENRQRDDRRADSAGRMPG